jgi:meso-butanediol dehydrogenase/(S,S)-butanediol dehydrogenase/diacetyl reductase
MDMRFQDQGVLVTGAASGIGRQVAMAFAEEGARVAVADIDQAAVEATAADIRKKGGEAHAFTLDVVKPDAVHDFIAGAESVLGRLDVLANCAGVREISPLLDLSFEDWQRTMGINVTGSFLPSQAFARRLIALGKPGRIVNIASTLGLVATPERVAYVTSKHAVVGLTKALAMELAPNNIRVNAVAPGVIRTPMTERYFQDAETSQKIRNIHAMGRWGETQEVANAMLFLASEASSFTTGAVLTVDGGWTLGKKMM